MKWWPWALGAAGVGLAAYAAGQVVPRLGLDQPQGLWFRAVEVLGGRTVSPDPYAQSTDGLTGYLVASRATYFTAHQLTAPGNPGIAQGLGYTENGLPRLLPPKRWWPKLAALSLLAQNVSQGAADKPEVRNVWRPEDYNQRVEGEDDSAHIRSEAIDLDFDSTADRRHAEGRAQYLQRTQRWLQVGMGVGSRTLHLDILTAKLQRPNTWCYPTAPECTPWSGQATTPTGVK